MNLLYSLIENAVITAMICLGIFAVILLIIIIYILYYPVKGITCIIHKIKGE